MCIRRGARRGQWKTREAEPPTSGAVRSTECWEETDAGGKGEEILDFVGKKRQIYRNKWLECDRIIGSVYLRGRKYLRS